MKPFSVDKSASYLFVIIGIGLALVIGLFLALRSDAVDQALKSDRILNVLVILEVDGKPKTTELFLYYPATQKGALLDVPVETGLIIKRLNRVDRIDALYDPRHPKAYVDEIAKLLSTEIPYWLILDAKGLSDATDLLEGLELFVPEEVHLGPPDTVHLPAGALILDGAKVLQFAKAGGAEEGEVDRAGRRQKLVQSFLKRVGERSAWLDKARTFSVFKRTMRTNLNDEATRRLFDALGGMDADRLLLQRVTGLYKTVDGKSLLFPHYDGELVRDIVKQTLNALSNAGASGAADKIYTVEILNGTPAKGLAKKTAEIFQSFGYDVVSVGNADREDYDKTQILDRLSNPDAAKNVASVIRCLRVVDQRSPSGQATADFTVILGDDFNGRYCAK